MAATKQDISEWFNRGVQDKADYMIVVCDTYDWDDYPVYANKSDVHAKYQEHNGPNMQKVMEVYDLHSDKDEQMNERRANRLPALT